MPLVFQRYLRPGDYRMVVKLEDLNGKKFLRGAQALTVPVVEGPEVPGPPLDPQTKPAARPRPTPRFATARPP